MTQHGGKRPNAGRPKGKPNAVTADVRDLAQQYGPSALATLASIMENEEAPEAARVAASRELLDRAYGKSKQSIDHTTNGESIKTFSAMYDSQAKNDDGQP